MNLQTQQSEAIKSKEQLEQIADYLKVRNKRNYIFFILAVSTGINLSSLVSLSVGEVRGKSHLEIGNTTIRKIPVSKDIRNLLREYTKGRAASSYLFENYRNPNKPLNNVYILGVLRKAYKELGMTGTYSLRKTFGYWYYKEHKDICSLKYVLGHNSAIDSLNFIGWNDKEGVS